MTDEERIERLENKLKEALSWWRAAEKQRLQKCKETTTNQKTIERLKAENAELRHRAEVAETALLTACINLIKDEEDNVNMELLAHVVYTKFLRKAEKELAEGKKDD